jgi:hypothetical protein
MLLLNFHNNVDNQFEENSPDIIITVFLDIV